MARYGRTLTAGQSNPEQQQSRRQARDPAGRQRRACRQQELGRRPVQTPAERGNGNAGQADQFASNPGYAHGYRSFQDSDELILQIVMLMNASIKLAKQWRILSMMSMNISFPSLFLFLFISIDYLRKCAINVSIT
jgi:hypothetical protein